MVPNSHIICDLCDRGVLEPMGPVECLENLDLRYKKCSHPHICLTMPLQTVLCIYTVHINITCSSSQGDRGFDGLPGLPGEKGHRVSMKR